VPDYPSTATVSSKTLDDGTKVVTLAGEFDLANVAAVRLRLNDLLAGDRGNLVVDMSGVSLVDSTMLSTLVSAARRAKRGDRGLVLVQPSRNVWRAFTITGLDRVFVACGDMRSALARLARDTRPPEVPRVRPDPLAERPPAA
jgi:anti-sigma B factor antagonist